MALTFTTMMFTLIASVMLSAKSAEPPYVDSQDQIVYEGRVLTDVPGEKYHPILSLDGKKLSFLYKGTVENGFIHKIGVIDLKTSRTEDIILEEGYATTYSQMVWLDHERIGVMGHVNPSLDEFYVMNISNHHHEVYHGIGFTIDQLTGKVFYTLPQPHFGEGEQGKNQIIDSDGNIYYESPSNVMIVGGPYFDSLGTRVAFFEYDSLADETQLVVADRSSDHQFENINKQRWDFALGTIRWKTRTLIEVETESSDQVLEYDLSSLTTDDQDDPLAKILRN